MSDEKKFAKRNESVFDLGACEAIVFRAVREDITDGYFIKLFSGVIGSHAKEFFTKDGETFHVIHSAITDNGQLIKGLEGEALRNEETRALLRQATALWARTHKTHLDSLASFNPVAIRLRQPFVNAQERETWGTVTCDECGEQFGIGYNRIYGNPQEEAKYVAYFQKSLNEEHTSGHVHRDAYELPELADAT